jgi:hypothetical protein
LLGHRDLEDVLAVNEVVVAVVAEVDADPVDLAGKGVACADWVVAGHGSAGVLADVGGLVERVGERVRVLDATGADRLPVDVEADVGALAKAAAVVGDLEADLMLAPLARARPP